MYTILIINKTFSSMDVEKVKVIPRIGEQYYTSYATNVVNVIHGVSGPLLKELGCNANFISEYTWGPEIDVVIIVE
jgi:hypothetical protein